jgi:hypothetical protein
MQILKRSLLFCLAAVSGFAFTTTILQGAVIEGWNWAESVTAYSDKIQNYGGILMDDSTTFWLTGEPDADVDGNGYAWDDGDLDYVGGWRTSDTDQFITLCWEDGIADVTGDDLVLCLYSGSKASANVLASVDGIFFTQVGTVGGGTAGILTQQYLDLDGLFGDQVVYYVQVQRVAIGAQTGMFFDAFGAASVPEPGTFMLFAIGLAGLFVFRRRRRCQ